MTTRLGHLRALAHRHSDEDLGAALAEALTMLDAAEARAKEATNLRADAVRWRAALVIALGIEADPSDPIGEARRLRDRVAELERAQLRAEVVT